MVRMIIDDLNAGYGWSILLVWRHLAVFQVSGGQLAHLPYSITGYEGDEVHWFVSAVTATGSAASMKPPLLNR